MTVDFGFVPMLSVGSTVFYDVDDNGMQDADNPLEYRYRQRPGLPGAGTGWMPMGMDSLVVIDSGADG